jgi:hypothetical protein
MKKKQHMNLCSMWDLPGEMEINDLKIPEVGE